MAAISEDQYEFHPDDFPVTGSPIEQRKGEPRLLQPIRFDYHNRSEMDSAMQEDENARDRIDSLGNDSLLHLNSEELAQREQEIFGDKISKEGRQVSWEQFEQSSPEVISKQLPQRQLSCEQCKQVNPAIFPQDQPNLIDERIPSIHAKDDKRIPAIFPQNQSSLIDERIPSSYAKDAERIPSLMTTNSSSVVVGGRHRPIGQYIRDLVMWRNTKDSIVIFAAGGFLLFALSYFSFITIVAYAALCVLLLATALVFGKSVLHNIYQRADAHPFQRLLDREVVISPNYAHQQLDNLLVPLNETLLRMRNVFLVDSLGQSLQMALILYVLTYVGAWFNLLTVVMIVWMAAFSMPKLYMMNRGRIDGWLQDVKRRWEGFKAWLGPIIRRQTQRIRDIKVRRLSVSKAAGQEPVSVEKKVIVEKKKVAVEEKHKKSL